MKTDILTYEEAFAQGPQVAGGKAWNLARLARYGFAVPRGGVLPAENYRRLIERPHLHSQIAALWELSAEDCLRAEVAERASGLVAAISTEPLDDEAITAIQQFSERTRIENTPLAVRSSAVAEDGAVASFAGIHESSLDVRGPESIRQAVCKCYASLWTPQAIAYRRRMNIPDSDMACAVLLCEMVTGPNGGLPPAAGVAFSCDPVTGRRDVLTVNLAAGLGDAVVRGDVNPDRYVLDAAHGHQVIEREVRRQALLTDRQLAKLGQLIWRVHWALGEGQDPQDVEWVFDGHDFWLVQSRPVTRLPRYTFAPVLNQPLTWSNGNLKDSFPEPVTTMTAAMTELVVGEVLFASQLAIDYTVPPGMPVMRRIGGRFYFDLSALQWSLYDAFGILPAEVNRTTGGFQPEISVPQGNPLAGRSGRPRARRRLKLLWALGRFRRRLPQDVEQVFSENRQARQASLSSLSDFQLAAELQRRIAIGNAFVPKLQLAASYYGAWMTVLQDFLAWSTGDRRQSLVTRLLAGTGGVASAEHGYRLVELAELARHDRNAWELLRSDDGGAWRRLPESSTFRQAFERYLDEFGHRGVLEMEFASPRWRDEPLYLVGQIRALLDSDIGPDPRERAAQVRAAAESELASMPWYTRPIARWLLTKTRAGAVLREEAKSAAAASVDTIQMTLLEIGRRLASRGTLIAPRDVFHLSLEEVHSLLEHDWGGDGVRSLVADRKRQFARYAEASTPDLIVEGAKTAWHSRSEGWLEESLVPGDRWLGIAAAPGVAEGSARVLTRAAEGSTLRTGEVLIAPSTDPGWTPLFLRASAVVMETGGYLSHGAVVAREYGIPSVVNVPAAMTAIVTGDPLVVDGDRGEVRRLRVAGQARHPATDTAAQT